MPPVVAKQVKEKYGSLRFRFRGGNDQTRHLIELAEDQAARVCEECGQPVEPCIGDTNHVQCTSCGVLRTTWGRRQ